MAATIAESACEVHLQHLGTSPENGLAAVFPSGMKFMAVEVPATADDTDIVTINHLAHGITTVEYFRIFTHTTDDSVIITEAGSTVTSPTITGQMNFTIGGSTDNKKRVILIGGT